MNELEKMIMKLTLEYAKIEAAYFQAQQKIKDIQAQIKDLGLSHG